MFARNLNKLKIMLMTSLILFITFNLLFNNNKFFTNTNDSNLEYYNDNNLKSSAPDINGKPLLVHQYSTITNSFFPSSLPSNVSFTLFNSWISQNVEIEYEGVSQKIQRVSNGAFDTGSDGWLYKSNNPSEYIDQGWQSANGNPPGCIQIRVDNGAKNQGDYGYYEQNITIPEKVSFELISRLSVDYYLTGNQPNHVLVYLAVIMNNVEKNVTFDFQTYLITDSWASLSMNYDPSLLGQIGPGNATIRIGIYTDSAVTVNPFAIIRFDNIKFDLWSMPDEPYLVNVFDIEFGLNYSYSNSSYGKGYTSIDIKRTRDPTDDVIFTIIPNKTGVLDLFVYNITIHSSLVRDFNTTILGEEGSKYTPGEEITWETNINFSEYYKYGAIWAEIIKPTDWNIIHVYDRDNIDRVSSCLNVGIGTNKTTIPVGIMTSSNIERPWKIIASSENYISKANIAYWNGTSFEEVSKITIGDIFYINVTLNNSLTLSGTQLNCTIKYPNGTIFWNDSKVISSYNHKFGNFTADNNMTAGTYQVTIEWVNNQSYIYNDKAGFKIFNFVVWHHTNLTAIDSYIEILAGDPLLIKVKFIDYDFNSIIEFANVNFSSTFGPAGTMVYIGSGIYFSEIDTNSLDVGNYYFSFSAEKSFYENKTINNLIHLKVIPQPLTLELSDSIIETNANTIISCQVNVTGSITKTLLWPANVSTDWFNPYNITDHNNGTYTLDFSTENIPISGYLESYTIEILANKTEYGNANTFLTLLVHPIPTIARVNTSLFSVYQDEIIKVRANYTDEGSNELISGANCTVSWQSSYLITPISNEFEITLNTTGLNVGYYTALITFKRAGYQTAFTSLTIIINEKQVNILVTINQIEIIENSLVEAYFQQLINISVRVATIIEPEYLSGGFVTFISDYYQINLTESPSTYFNTSIILDGAYFDSGINTIFLRFQQTNYSTTIFAFQLYIRAQSINLTVQINNQDVTENSLIEFYYNQIFHLSCRAFAEIESRFLSGGNITFVHDEQEIELIEYEEHWFNLSIIISNDTFSLGVNNVYIRFEQINYTTTIFAFQLYIRAQSIDLTVQINYQDVPENYLFEISYNQIFHLSCRAFAEIESKFLSGGNITFVNGEYEIELIEYEQNWFNLSILVSASTFSLGPNYAYIRFQQNNYTTTTFSIQIFVNQIEIKVEPLNFQELVEGIEGNDITIRLRLMEDLSSEIIANATIFYSWNFGNGYFEYISNGTYESKLSLPIGYSGNYPCRLVISMESLIYKSFEYSIIINIIQKEVPNYFLLIIIISLIAITSILGTLSIRNYVLLPRKRRKESELLAKTQRYKDVMNIEALFISQRQSGLYIYSKDYYYITEEDQSELLTGFIHAITLLSTRVAGKEELKEMAIISKDYKSIEKIIELDFKHFNFFISDYKDIRITFILKEKASERFKNQTAQLLSDIDSRFSEILEKWDGNLEEFSRVLPSLLNQYFQLPYRELFKLNNAKYIDRIQKEQTLSKMELRLLNVIISMTKEREEFYLEDAITSIHEKNKDKTIEALESLIERKIVLPSKPSNLSLNSDSNPILDKPTSHQ